jgi:hypothetical protein
VSRQERIALLRGTLALLDRPAVAVCYLFGAFEGRIVLRVIARLFILWQACCVAALGPEPDPILLIHAVGLLTSEIDTPSTPSTSSRTLPLLRI